MAVKEAVRVVSPLDLQKSRVVGAPERTLPVRLEVVRLVDVGAAPGRRGADAVHRCGHAGLLVRALGSIRMVPGNLVRAGPVRTRDDQGGGVEDDRVDGRVAI